MKGTVELLREVSLKVGRLTTKILREELGDDLEYFGDIISISKLKILAFANEEETGKKYSDLYHETGLAKSTLSITINELCDLGMVSKEVRGTSADTYIRVTDFGKHFVDIYHNVENRLNKRIFGSLSLDEVEFIDKYLRDLDEIMKYC